jgi:hypothetical protein
MGKKEKVRKHYQKPKINQVELAMDEAVLTNCKWDAADTSGKNSKGCGFAACKTTFGS